jgi:dimethylglycine catabolism A
MWKPPERIKHAVDSGPWPSATQASSATWFAPIKLGQLDLKDRTWVPAMVPWRASSDGDVTPNVIEWYARLAMGKPAVIVVEATGIQDIASGPLLRISDDRFVAGLTELVEAVRTASNGETKLFIQLIDFLNIRRRPEPSRYFNQFLRITDEHRAALGQPGMSDDATREALAGATKEQLRECLSPRELEALHYGHRERVTDTHLPHIRNLPSRLPSLFADAAQRAQDAGFNGIELHYAHAYTMASFLSRRNTREDGYGTTPDGRARAPLEVFRAVRERLGADFCIGARILSEEGISDGSTVDDAAWFACQFADAGMDFLSFSRGGKFEDARQPKPGWSSYPYTGPSGFECMPTYIADEQGPFGRNVKPTAHIRASLRDSGHMTPVIVCGGIHDFAQAEKILSEGDADIVGAARQSLADPDWLEKVRTGNGAQVQLCKYTNYCEGLDQKHKQVTCQLWDRKALDCPTVALSLDGKRRLTAPSWQREDTTNEETKK